MRLRVRGLVGGLVLLVAVTVGPGDASTAAESKPVVGKISAGWGHACAIASSTSIRCWGDNEFGQLGNGTMSHFDPNPVPGEVHSAGSGIEAVASGLNHTCTIAQGSVRCWGWNAYGQLGTGDSSDRLAPTESVGMSGTVTAVVAGSSHTCAVVGGGVQCWGNNEEGQLGNGQAGCDPENLQDCQSPTPVTVSGLGGVTGLAAGTFHTCALTSGGSVSCWGGNRFGQLGNGGTTGFGEYQATPVGVSGLSGAKGIALGADHSCAVTGAGGIKCWGENGFGQIGDGTTTNRPTPVTIALKDTAQIVAGWDHTCLISTKGGVACWGRNQFGELGDGTTKERHRPVAVSGLGLGSGVIEVTGGYQFTCALLPDNEVRCWGKNDIGQLGDGTTDARTKPVVTLFDCFGQAPTIVARPGESTIGTEGDDVIFGTNGINLIDGKGGADFICGFGGNDKMVSGNDRTHIEGGLGDDEIAGGDGIDQLSGGGGNDNITGGDGQDDIFGDSGEDKLRGDEDYDRLHGGEGVDLLLGGEGPDILSGEVGSDILNGGPGRDVLYGGDDNDLVVGGADNDEEYGGEGEDVMTGGGGADRMYGGIGDDHMNGDAAADRLWGDQGDDLLFGGTGSDYLFGEAGDDDLTGNGDRDILHGGPGTDHDDGGNNNDSCWGEVFEGCFEKHSPG